MKPTFDHDPNMSVLAAKFADFRRVRRYARIPDPLRREVIAALDAGADLTFVLKSLSLTGPQIAVWRDRLSSVKRSTPAMEPPRILDVIAAQPKSVPTPTGLRVSCEPGRVLLEFSF